MVLAAALLGAAFTVVGDGIPAPLTDAPGDAGRGRAIVANRQQGLCLLCHGGPLPEAQLHGNLAGNLSGAGSRWSAAQLRLRVADARRLDPQGLMPSLYRSDGFNRVAPAYAGQPVLSAQQVEDVVAFLLSLK